YTAPPSSFMLNAAGPRKQIIDPARAPTSPKITFTSGNARATAKASPTVMVDTTMPMRVLIDVERERTNNRYSHHQEGGGDDGVSPVQPRAQADHKDGENADERHLAHVTRGGNRKLGVNLRNVGLVGEGKY
ncbi:hypothetical protein FOZ62_017056, partial [Perkinsus olseni]